MQDTGKTTLINKPASGQTGALSSLFATDMINWQLISMNACRSSCAVTQLMVLYPVQLLCVSASILSPCCCSNIRMDGSALLEAILLSIFCVDILISFFLGYYDEAGLLVMDNIPVAWNYFRWAHSDILALTGGVSLLAVFQELLIISSRPLWHRMVHIMQNGCARCVSLLCRRRFFVDLLTTLPWEWMVLSATGIPADSQKGRYIGLLSLLRLGRMYRVMVLFYNMSYNLSVGLMTLTLVRNFTVSVKLAGGALRGGVAAAVLKVPKA